MWFRKKMPDAVLRRCLTPEGSYLYHDLVRTFVANGKRWYKFRQQYLLLKDDGTVVGDPDAAEWEAP